VAGVAGAGCRGPWRGRPGAAGGAPQRALRGAWAIMGAAAAGPVTLGAAGCNRSLCALGRPAPATRPAGGYGG